MIGLLIVDDEEVTRRGLATAVDWRSCGVELVGVAASGLEALRELETHHPAIVVLDVRTPDLDGIGVLSIIRARYPHTRAILVSGYEDFADAQRAVNLSAFAFLSKPLDPRILRRTVREAADAVREEQSEVRSSEELRREFDRFAPALRTSYLCRLMSPAAWTEEEALAQATFLGLPPPAAFPGSMVASVVVLDVARQDSAAGSDSGARVAADEFDRFALAQRVEADLRSRERGFAFPFGDCVCLVVFHEPAERGELRGVCKEHIGWAASALGAAVAAGIGKPAGSLTELHASYESALRALEYRFMLGRSEAIDFEEVRELAIGGMRAGPSLAELRAASAAIAQGIRAGSVDRATAALKEVVGELGQRLHLPPRTIPRSPPPQSGAGLGGSFAYLLSFVLTDIQLSLGMQREEDILARLASCRTVEEARD